MLIYKNDEDVKNLFEAFEKRTLPKADWTHPAHLTVALFYCLNYPFGTARHLMRDGIHWLNAAHGTPNTETSGYHETLTCFWMLTVNRFLEKREYAEGLAVLANELVASVGDTKLPLKYYSRELLFAVEARKEYVAPDLMTDLDFSGMFDEKLASEFFG